jgi:hypothetical protein
VGTKNRKAKRAFEYGSVTKYLEPYIKELEVGQVVEIPINEFGQHRLQSTSGAWFNRVRGIGSQTSTFNKENNTIEVLRLL